MLRLVLFLGLAVQGVFGSCNVGWVEYDGFCYLFGDRTLTFYDAAGMCEIYRSRLVQIDSKEENDFLALHLNSIDIEAAYIGGSSMNHEGIWEWIPSFRLFNETYTNWRTGEPNLHKTEHCAAVHKSGSGGQWNNIPCTEKYRYICKKRVCKTKK
ncbi:hypothetical protein BsWGS_23784 [Bradybaena similaris]